MIIKFIILILLNINNIDEINRLTKEAEIYFKNKATCLSILTEEDYFLGKLDHIKKIKQK